jgi:hypothetical protein
VNPFKGLDSFQESDAVVAASEGGRERMRGRDSRSEAQKKLYLK